VADAKIVYRDRAELAETFADHCERVVFEGQTLRAEFAVTRLLPGAAGKQAQAVRTTACRLVLTPQAALQLHGQLLHIVEALEKKGVVKRGAKEPVTQQ
jgi:hypothetical protein